MSESTPLRALVGLAAFVVVVGGMRVAEPVLVPFLLALLLAMLTAPLLLWLVAHGIPKALSLTLVLLLLLGVGGAFGGVLGRSLGNFSAALPEYSVRLEAQAMALLQWLRGRGVRIEEEEFFELVDPTQVLQFTGVFLNSLAGVLTDATMILIVVGFLLAELSSLREKLWLVAEDPEATRDAFRRFERTLRRYVVIKTATSLVTGLLIGSWMWLLGIDYAALWGLLAFLLNYIPSIGSVIASIPAIFFALVDAGFGAALWAGGGYLAVNNVIGNVIEPRIMGRGVGLSTLVVILSLVFWGWVLGPLGMFLSVPLTMTLKIALDSRPDTRWLGVLLGPGPESEEALAEPDEGHPEPAGQEVAGR